MRRTVVAAVALALALPVAAEAETPVWAETFPVEPGSINVVDAVRSGTSVAVLGGGTLVKSTDFGTTWAPLNPLLGPPTGGSSQTRVATSSPTRWFAENGDAVSTTADAGLTWQRLSVPPVVKDPRERFEFASNIATVDGAPFAVVGWEGARIRGLCPYAFGFTPVFVTRDAGRSWKRTDLPGAGTVWSADWLDGKRAALTVIDLEWTEPVGDEDSCGTTGRWVSTSFWVTTDGGSTWRRALRTKEWWGTAAWASPSTFVAIGETNGVARAYVSVDGARRFRKPVHVYTTPGTEQSRLNGYPALDFADGRRGWLGAIAVGVHRTDSGGSEWSHEVSPADGAFYGLPDMAAFDLDRAVLVGPHAISTRTGKSVPLAGPVAAPPAPVSLVETVSRGRVVSELHRPAYGPPTALLATR